MNNSSFEIPYHLETIEEITNAMSGDLLRRTDYRRLLHFAKNTTLHQPHALIKAKKKVTKDFIIVDEEKIRDVKINFSQVANLPLVEQYPLVMESLPWMHDIICHENFFHFFHSFPLKIRKRFLLEHLPDSPLSMYSAILAIRKLLKRDLIVYVKAQKTSTLSLVQLKKSLVALTVLEPGNEDVLLALKTEKTSENSQLHQNAMAEILFARLPKTIQGLLNRNLNNLVQRLSLKMSHLNLSSRHITNLMGYTNKKMTSDDLYKALKRIDGVAMKISIPQESKKRLHDYIESMKKNMDRAPSVYRSLFLSSELETCQKLYRPTKVMKSEETVTERTIRHYTRLSTLDFYATKDFFDLIKAKFSSDCTDTYLGEKQLMTPHFFNIRIFRGQKWIGNIYMLDFCEGHDSLIIDRIQIPRELKASYHQFFDYLKEVLIEMFEDVRYKYILMPLKISNHGTIQNIFNKYKKKLTKKENFFDSPFADHFESLSGKTIYYVLHERPQIVTD